MAAEHPEHPGIAYSHQGTRTISQIVRGLLLLHATLTPDEMRGRIHFL